ncbi:MAG: hypothetical protein J6C33_02155 [Lachnospiraceae bacterium]|nr:hypothetical protein [Lachnospiraceae bacterium]
MRRINRKRAAALGMTAILAFGTVSADLQAAAPQVRVDESVYVNLDYYGGVDEVNIVKGCMLNGNTEIVDYGDYKEVINMSNGAAPTLEGGKVTWDLSGQKDERFYFECKTDTLTQELPWNLDVTYKLNGKECKAEELAGASGMVTILVAVSPNSKAPEYYKNNMILTVATLVDMDDDNYSLEAPGSQLQTLGTKKAVMFMALPGEEGTFRIDIGTNSFESIGLMFMMVPATLSSLDRISDIREVKDKVRDSVDAMSESADVILDNLVTMKGSLEETQKGVKAAQEAKKTFDAGEDQAKADADAAINSLDGIINSLTLLSAQTAIEKADYVDAMNQLETIRQSVYEMDDYLEDMEDASKDLQDSLDDLRKTLKSGASDAEKLEDAEDLLENLAGADQATAGDVVVGKEVGQLGRLLAAVSKDAAPVMEDTEALVHELENLINKTSEVLNEGYTLGGHMTQDYKDHILMLIDEIQMTLDSTNVSVLATQQALRSMRSLMDATEKSLDAAIDSSLSGMIGILDSGIGIAGGSEVFRDAKNTMKDAVDEELDEIEDETNILNIDTQEQFPSFTSSKNASPESIQIIMRTAEISIDDDTDNTVDLEKAPEDIGVWGRLKAVFVKIYHWFVKE